MHSRDNTAQNKVANDAAKDEGLNKDETQELHREISDQKLSYQQIRQVAQQIKAGR